MMFLEVKILPQAVSSEYKEQDERKRCLNYAIQVVLAQDSCASTFSRVESKLTDASLTRFE
jgi:hypothetical protein